MATAAANDWRNGLARNAPGWFFMAAVLGLSLFGLIILYSATRTQDAAIVTKQAMWLSIALVAGAITYCLDLEKIRSFFWPLFASALGLLGLVLVAGREINGAKRWIDLGPMNFQVSDFAKIALVLLLADYLARNQRELQSFRKGFAQPLVIVGLLAGLIFLQPDYGTAALTGFVGVSMLFLAGVRLSYLLPTGVIVSVLFSIAVYLDPVRLKRITSFLDIEANKSDGAYQLWQGILAFGAGGWSGVGLGNGRQQMAFLPEAHTDFIFPVIGEELGFVFTAGVALIFGAIFILVWSNLKRAPSLYAYLIAAGALLLITTQALINFGVSTGLLPTKGMSLPFISYGGSNLVGVYVLVGLILNCFREWNRPALRRASEL